MTESRSRRPAASPTTGRSRSPAQPEPAESPGTTIPDEAVAAATGAAVEPAELAKPTEPVKPGQPPAGRGWSLHLPFVTLTVGPQPMAPVPTDAGTSHGTIERLAFYGGVATLGVLGVLDWPVAAAVATGTWVAQHTLPRPPARAA